MIRAIDGPGGRDDWEHIDWDKKTVFYEESGIIKPLSSKLFEFHRGKYEGLLVSDVDNTPYMKFIRDKNQDDPLLVAVINLRLTELNIE